MMTVEKMLSRMMSQTVKAMFGRDLFKWVIVKVDGEWRMFPPCDDEHYVMVVLGGYYTFPTGAQALEAFRRGQ